MGVLAPVRGFEPGSDVTLAVPSELVDWGRERDGIELTDPEGVPLAVVTVDDTYRLPGGMTGIIGSVTSRPGRRSRAFGHLYVTPATPRTDFPDDMITVVVTRPLSVEDVAAVERSIGHTGRSPMFLVLAGEEGHTEVSVVGLIRSVVLVADRYAGSRVVVVPAAERDDPEVDRAFKKRVVEAYAPGPEVVWGEGDGTLDPTVEQVVAADRPVGVQQGVVVLFTGLSGSGKSTIAEALRDRLLESGERTVSFLDGDRVRRNLSRGLTFSREDRETNIERIGWVAAEVARHGGAAICSPIAPFDRTRKWVRHTVEEVGAVFVLVHVATPLAECERRDRKGLYARARRGEIEQFTGISSPYEVPTDAELVIDTTGRTLADELDEVLDHLIGRGLLSPSVRTACAVQSRGSTHG